MTIFSHILDESLVFVYPEDQQVSKDQVIRQLCEAVAEDLGGMDANQIESLVQQREVSLSTRLSPLLAVPHAVIPESNDNSLAAAVIPGGLDWDSDCDNPVRLVMLLAGGQKMHLRLLSEMAAVLQDEEFVRSLVSASNASEFLDLLLPSENISADRLDISSLIFKEAERIRDSIGSARLLLHADAIDDDKFIESLVEETDAVIVTSRDGRFNSRLSLENILVVIPFKGVKRSAHVQFTLMYLLSRKVLKPTDIIVNVFGSPGSGFLDSIRLTRLEDSEIPFSTGTEGFPDDLEISTFTRVLQVATQIAQEGREGKPVGTLFVVGDYKGVSPYTRQMIINPFHGYPREDRNILDPSIEETVKEFARIDGAFIINGDGTIESAGTYLSGQPTAEEMHSGLGARHAAAQGISAVSSALAVAISESTRKISVFKSGQRIMEL